MWWLASYRSDTLLLNASQHQLQETKVAKKYYSHDKYFPVINVFKTNGLI